MMGKSILFFSLKNLKRIAKENQSEFPPNNSREIFQYQRTNKNLFD